MVTVEISVIARVSSVGECVAVQTGSMTAVGMEDFKNKVREMCRLEDDISEAAKMLKELRGRKTALQKEVTSYMKTENISSCNVPDGKLSLGTGRSLATVKKEDIAKAFAEALSCDLVRCEEILAALYDNRKATERTVLRRSRKRSRAAAAGPALEAQDEDGEEEDGDV